MADVCADVFTEWRVIPEDLVPLSLLSLVSRSRFILEGVLMTALVMCGCAAWSYEALSDERCEGRLLTPAGMFFVVLGWWLLSRWTYCSVVLGFV